MKTFKLTLRKQIHSCFAGMSTNDVWLYKDFELPFVPTVGLYLIDDDKNFGSQIEELCWMYKEQMFVGYTEEDKEIYNAQLHKQKHRTIEEIVKDYIECGWNDRRKIKEEKT